MQQMTVFTGKMNDSEVHRKLIHLRIEYISAKKFFAQRDIGVFLV